MHLSLRARSSSSGLHGIEETTSANGYDVVIYNVDTTEKRDRYFRTVPDPRRVDGVIVISLPPSTPDVARFQRSSVPIVFIDVGNPICEPFDRIVINDVEGGRMATQHLIDLGHRRIGYIGDVPQAGFNFTAGEIVPEPLGGAHSDWDRAAELLKASVVKHLEELAKATGPELVDRRYQKFARMGQFDS